MSTFSMIQFLQHVEHERGAVSSATIIKGFFQGSLA